MRLSILHVLQCTMVTRFNPIWERHRYMKLGSNLSTRNPTTSQSQKGYNIVQDDMECAQRLLNLASHAVRMKQRSDIIFPTSRRSVRTYARIKSTALNALFRCCACPRGGDDHDNDRDHDHDHDDDHDDCLLHQIHHHQC